jgi:hypothetical protein
MCGRSHERWKCQIRRLAGHSPASAGTGPCGMGGRADLHVDAQRRPLVDGRRWAAGRGEGPSMATAMNSWQRAHRAPKHERHSGGAVMTHLPCRGPGPSTCLRRVANKTTRARPRALWRAARQRCPNAP